MSRVMFIVGALLWFLSSVVHLVCLIVRGDTDPPPGPMLSAICFLLVAIYAKINEVEEVK